MPNHLSFIKDVLYSLTRDYGETIIVKRQLIGTTNYKTGAKNITDVIFTLKYVIRLPDQTSRISNFEFIFRKFALSPIADKKKRQFILNSRYLPTDYKPLQDDIFKINNYEYRVSKIEELENSLGYLIEAEEL